MHYEQSTELACQKLGDFENMLVVLEEHHRTYGNQIKITYMGKWNVELSVNKKNTLNNFFVTKA